MAKKEPVRRREIIPSLKEEKYRTNLFFNRFAIEDIDGHALIHFALVKGREQLAGYACLVEEGALNTSKDSMLKFLDSAGEVPEVAPPTWNPSATPEAVEVANMIHMARTDDSGEVRLGLYSLGAAIDIAKTADGKTEVSGNPLALLRCSLGMQRRLIMALFVERSPHA